MRTKKALLNSITALTLQLVTVICGLILPRMILSAFGSEINGALSSITQFLGYITLIEAGVGGVSRAALYKPLSNNDYTSVSGIIVATEKFFRKIAYIFILYSVIIAAVFPVITKNNLDWLFTFFLVLIIAISTFAQYFFGITYSVLIQADQRTYITNVIQIVTIILNTAISVVLIQLGLGVHLVKLVSASIFVLRPVIINIYVKRKYRINKKIPADDQAIRQRWNGLGHHIAFFIHNNTDIFVISVFLGLKWVSVYSVYFMICSGIKNVINAFISSAESAFGNMIARNENNNLNINFRIIETLTSVMVVLFFTTTGLLLLDFISIYTSGITDINYLILPFGILITVSESLQCIKTPYHSVVIAAGHFKQTQVGAYIEAGINVVFSVIAVLFLGITGVMIATVSATLFRIIDYVIYLRKNIISRSANVFIKRQIVNILNALSIIAICLIIPFSVPGDYFAWVLKALAVFSVAAVMTLIWNMIFYRKEIIQMISKIKNTLKKPKPQNNN